MSISTFAQLLKTVPALQSQLDALLEFDVSSLCLPAEDVIPIRSWTNSTLQCTANDLTNGVISSAFMLLFRDLIRLFACYNDGIINLLGACCSSLYCASMPCDHRAQLSIRLNIALAENDMFKCKKGRTL